ncbi:cytochrome P450 [Aspergillus karnatakaensis]|uniref:cytochrome P450 n=1 Tax=Aspergillus karnatakaensis TaxID=1810916 RepID=UPI003CCDE715
MALLDLFGSSHQPIAVVGILSVVYYLISYAHRKRRHYTVAKENGCKPVIPVLPYREPFFALDRVFLNMRMARERKLLENNITRFEELGNTIRGKRFTTQIFLTREPLNIKTILATKFTDYSMGDRLQVFGTFFGKGIFTSDGEDWSRSRHMVKPNFVKDQVAHLDIFEELLDDFFALIPSDGSTVDLQDLFFGLTIDSATEFLYGHSVHSLKKQLSGVSTKEPDFSEAYNYSLEYITKNSRLGPLMAFNRDPKAAEANRICHEVVDQYVDKAVRVRERYDEEKGQTEGRRYTFLQGLAQQTGDRTRIRDELMNLLLAGRDTTASLMSNMWFMLAKHPEAWAKLQEEIATLEGRAPTYDQLRNLKYLKYCLNECRCNLRSVLIYADKYSSPSPSCRPSKLTNCGQRHRHPSWRWSGRKIACSGPERGRRRVQCLGYAPP